MQLATEHYRAGRYADALRLYQAAYDIFPTPRVLFNVGLAREKNFDYEGCAVAFRQYIPDAPEPALASRAEENMARCLERVKIPVKVTSLPAGAATFVDAGRGRSLKGRTPLTELALAPGKYGITLTMPGYVDQTQEVTVEAGQRPTVDFILERLSSLHIETDVQGARVRIGDAPFELAPVTREVPAGVYEVRVHKPGHRPAQREVRIEPGQQVSLVLSLPLADRASTLSIRAPGDATLRIDGQEQALPFQKQARPGDYEVRVTAPGRVPFAGTVEVPPSSDVELRMMLSPDRSTMDRGVTISLVGAAGAALLVGGAFGLLALQEQGDFDARPTRSAASSGEDHARRADTMLATSAAFAASAALYWWFTRPEPSKVRSTVD